MRAGRSRAAAPPGGRPKGVVVGVDARGLRPNSSRGFTVYKGNKCVKIGRIGRDFSLPAGQYEARIGFPSGWVSRPLTLGAGQKKVTIPTGLFRFRDITPAGGRSTVPQKLYSGDKYLATGYQGMTARLYPGAYTVRYHAPADVNRARSLRKWHVIGPFPADRKKDGDLKKPYPPEEADAPDFDEPITVNKRKYTWRKVEGDLEMNLRSGLKGGGFVYLAAQIESPSKRRVQLTFFFRGGMKVWLNGEVIWTVPVGQKFYITRRIESFPTLRKGKNLLLAKTYANQYTYWPFSAAMESWRSYQVTIRGGRNTPDRPTTQPAPDPAPKPLPPVKGIKGVVFCQVPDEPSGRSGLHYEQFRIVRRPKRARICTLIPAAPDGKLTDLTGGRFVAAIHPDLSYDGDKIIFSARKTNGAGDWWNIYEMSLDGSNLRRITRDMRDCIDPYYLPNGRVVFSSSVQDIRDEYDRDPIMVLYTCKLDGSDVEQITFNLSGDTASIVLNDGRILFTSWQHHGDHQGIAGIFAFCTVLPDGTNFMPFTGNHREMNNTKSYAQQLADGRVVVVESAGHRHYNSGGLTTVHPRKPLTTRKILTPGMIYNGNNLAGRYASPYPLPDGGMICSYSPGRGTAKLREDPAEEIHMGIYRFDFQAGRPGRLIFDDPVAQDYDAIAIYKRPMPPAPQRMVVDGKKTGTFFCVNAYLSDRPVQNKRTVVGELPPAKPGEIRSVRVTEGFGVMDKDRRKHLPIAIDILQMSFGSSNNGGNNFEQKSILGYAPVHKDGSFYIEVPADTVLSLQTLDKEGMAIETQLTWVWVRPGESRMCIGCHEDRETALANTDCMAMRQGKAHFVAPPPEERRTVDFRRDIMPIVEKNCSLPGCHGAKTKAGGLDLRKGFELVFHRCGIRGRKLNAAMFNHAYESFLQAPANRVGTLVRPGAARHSPLIWRLYGKKLGWTDQRNPYTKKINRMPPNRPLTGPELKLMVEWVDIGAQWDNITGEDDLPGYDSVQSKKLAVEAEKRVRAAILDPKEAYTVRCLECHDSARMTAARKMPADKSKIRRGGVPAMVKRMDAKRRGWIHKEEIPLLVEHIRKLLIKPKPPNK